VTFFEIFEIFGGGKVTPDHETEIFYLLYNLYTHQEKELWFSENFLEVQRFNENFPKILSLEKEVKKGKVIISRLL
jgi:hypothetical protein